MKLLSGTTSSPMESPEVTKTCMGVCQDSHSSRTRWDRDKVQLLVSCSPTLVSLELKLWKQEKVT